MGIRIIFASLSAIIALTACSDGSSCPDGSGPRIPELALFDPIGG